MLRERLSRSPGGRHTLDEHPAVLDTNLLHWDAVRFEAGLALLGPAVEFPIVPGAHHIVAVERAFTERPADVVADARDRAEFTVLEYQRDPAATQQHLLQRLALPAPFMRASARVHVPFRSRDFRRIRSRQRHRRNGVGIANHLPLRQIG